MALATLVFALLVASPALAADEYQVDPIHSGIIFKIMHADAGFIWGRFTSFEGTIMVDEDNPEASSAEFRVDAASINTAVDARDNHLRSADFFGVDVHPTITFSSTGIKPNDDGSYELSGEITLLGVTRSVTARLSKTGEVDDPKRGHVMGFEVLFSVMRSDFGMEYGLPGIGDEVQMIVNAEAIRQDAG